MSGSHLGERDGYTPTLLGERLLEYTVRPLKHLRSAGRWCTTLLQQKERPHALVCEASKGHGVTAASPLMHAR